MVEERSERIRELEQRISQWQRVHNHEVQQVRDSHSNLRETLTLSMRVVAIGSIPSVIWLIFWVIASPMSESLFGQIFAGIAAFVVYGIVAAGAARGSGLLAHWWFFRSNVHQRVATVCIALSTDALMFWWVIVLARW